MIKPEELGLDKLEKQYNLPSGLLSAVMMKESSGNPNAVSKAGAQGLFQFMPATAKAYGINPFDPLQSAVGAARMYGDLSKQFGGDVPSMLAAYNWGSGNLTEKGMQNAPAETRDYVQTIMGQLGKPTEFGVGEQMAQMQNIATDAQISDTIDVELPDGTIVEGVPSNITQAQLMQMMGQKQQSALGKFAKDMPRQLGLTGRYMAEGAASLADIPNMVVNAGIGGLNALGADIPELQYPSQMLSDALTSAGVPQPQGSLERVVGDVSKALSGAATVGGAATQIPKLKSLADNMALQARAAAGSAAASGTTREMGGGAGAQLAAGLAGGLAASRPKAPARVTSDDLRAKASVAYKKADDLGGVVSPKFTNKFLDELENQKPKPIAGKVITSEDKSVIDAIDEFAALRDQKMSLSDLQRLDESLGAKIDSNINPQTGRMNATGKKIYDMQTKLRDMMENVAESDVEGGKQGFQALKEARDLWARSSRLSEVERIIARADGTDHPATSIKAGFRTLRNNPKRMRGFTKEEQKAIKQAARTGVIGSILRIPGSRLLPIGTLATGNLGASVASQAAGIAARKGAELNQLNRAAKVAEKIANPNSKTPFVSVENLARASGVSQGLNATADKKAKKYGRKMLNKPTKITISPLPEVDLPDANVIPETN